MTREGIRDLIVVEQGFQSLVVSGENEVEAENQSLWNVAKEFRLLEQEQHMEAAPAQMPQVSEGNRQIETIRIAHEGWSEGLQSEHDQQSGQEQAVLPRKEGDQMTWGDENWSEHDQQSGQEQAVLPRKEGDQMTWGDENWPEHDHQSGQEQAVLPRKEGDQMTWDDENWQQDSWNSREANQQSVWDQEWPTEASSSQENVASFSASPSGWGLLPGEAEAAAYVDLGYFDQEIDILGSTLTVRVAYTAKGVEDWIGQYSAEDRLFGVDIEWRPNQFKGEDNMAALFQIAGKHGCLIVQLLYIDFIPDALKELLADPNVKLAGVGIKADSKKLFHDYGLKCRGEVDLGLHAAAVLNRGVLKRAGLATLCETVLGIPFKKIKSLTMSNWAVEGLSLAQITYAASDACISYSLLVALNLKAKECLSARSPRSSSPSV